MPRVEWSTKAFADLRAIAHQSLRQMDAIGQAVERFERGEATDFRKLSGRDERWRIRQGDWRVLLSRRPDGTYLVSEIRNRRDAYEE